MPRQPGIPALRRHKPSKQGVVTLNGKDRYLGVWPDGQDDPPPAVRAEYDRLISEWLAAGRLPLHDARPASAPASPAGPTVAELCLRFLRHAEVYYRKDDQPTSEVQEFVASLRPLVHLYGDLAAADLGPLKLKAVRELMVTGYTHPQYGKQKPLVRKLINHRVARIVRAFGWAVSEELVPESTWRALTSVKGLRKGRCNAREGKPVKPVPVEVVEATLPRLTPTLQGVVRLQLLTGMRSGESLAIRLENIDRSRPVWLYRVPSHKTTHHGRERVVAIGPQAQELLLNFVRVRCPCCGLEDRPCRLAMRSGLCGPCADRMDDDGRCGPWARIEVQGNDYLFSPRRAVEESRADRRAKRKTRVQPSQVNRKKAKPKRQAGERYSIVTYAATIYKASRAAGLEPWHPHQLRHTHATEVRRRFGLEAAQVALGHAQANISELYAERDMNLAVQVAAQMG